jgi:hypothetical protein
MAQALAAGVVMADAPFGKNKGTQDTNPAASHRHAMGGMTSPRTSESCGQAYDGTQKTVQKLLASGDPGDLAAAIHDIEDSYSESHQYTTWSGQRDEQHKDADNVYHKEAEQAVAALLRDMANHQPLDPAKYLYNPGAGCH